MAVPEQQFRDIIDNIYQTITDTLTKELAGVGKQLSHSPTGTSFDEKQLQQDIIYTIKQELDEFKQSLASSPGSGYFDEEKFHEDLLKDVEEIVEKKRLQLYYLLQVVLDRKLGELYQTLIDAEYIPSFVSAPMLTVPPWVLRVLGKKEQQEAFCPKCGYNFTNPTEDVCPKCKRQRLILADDTVVSSSGNGQSHANTSSFQF